jgi:sugar lactone lactonase YvrE
MPVLKTVAQSDALWTGVAVTPDGRVFVSYPRWSSQIPVSVGEVLPSGAVVPYPDAGWNAWSPGQAPEGRFVCVQSVTADDAGFLWILDAGNPMFRGVVPGAAKLVKVDPRRDAVLEVIPFGPEAAPEGSYLNDVRVDVGREWAYVTESGRGSLLAVDLKTKIPRAVLKEHRSVKAEDTVVTVEGVELRRPDGTPRKVHADGIALDAESDVLYFQALTGRTLYRLPARTLRDDRLTEGEVAAELKAVGTTGPADGLWFSRDGFLYITAIEENAIRRLNRDGTADTVVRDPRLRWPDSLAEGPDGSLYVTTSQLHLGASRQEPYRVLMLVMGDAGEVRK